ncbi:MAG: ribbon-helix-helix domain-containing protein [archaeon]
MSKLINMRMDEEFLKKIDSFLGEASFSNRTEFFKASARQFIDDWQTRQAIKELKQSRTWAKKMQFKNPTKDEFEKVRGKVWKELHQSD